MSSAIFIKTWRDDMKWMPYAMESIRRFASGFEEIVIAADSCCYEESVRVYGSEARVVECQEWPNGYIQQQAVKLDAGRIVGDSHEYILFVDSDCVFHTPFSPESFMRDGLPVLMKTPYGDLGGAEAWRSITSAAVGFDVEFEYMRRLPWMYRTSSLLGFALRYRALIDSLASMRTRDFSEFNALGAYIDRFESEHYYVTDTREWVPASVAHQFWSWGGVTEEVAERIRVFLPGFDVHVDMKSQAVVQPRSKVSRGRSRRVRGQR